LFLSYRCPVGPLSPLFCWKDGYHLVRLSPGLPLRMSHKACFFPPFFLCSPPFSNNWQSARATPGAFVFKWIIVTLAFSSPSFLPFFLPLACNATSSSKVLLTVLVRRVAFVPTAPPPFSDFFSQLKHQAQQRRQVVPSQGFFLPPPPIPRARASCLQSRIMMRGASDRELLMRPFSLPLLPSVCCQLILCRSARA